MNPTPTPLSPQVQEWRKEAERLALAAFGAGLLGSMQWGMANLQEVQEIKGVRMPITAEWLAFVAHLDAVPFNQVVQEPWYEGEPPFPQREEWFIAETIHGERVVLRALPEEFTYDYKTADETYIMAKNIKRWMQFPDCEYIAPRAASPQPVPVQEPVAWIEHHKAGDNLNWDRVDHPYAKATPLYAQPVRGEALLAEQPKSDKSYALVPVGSDLPPALFQDADASLIERFVSSNEQFHISADDHPTWLHCKDGDGNSTSLRGDWFAASLRQLINESKQ